MHAPERFNLSVDAGLGRRIDAAVFATWPALEEVRDSGWRLRAAGGATRRANSALPGGAPRGASPGDLDAAVARVEAFYAARGQPSAFRLSPFAIPPTLDADLAVRGYAISRKSLVMIRDLDPVARQLARAPAPTAACIYTSPMPLAIWEEIALGAPGAPDVRGKRRILDAAPAPKIYFHARLGNVAAAAGFGVAWGGFAGIYCVETTPAHRRKGAATALLAAFLLWAENQSATTAFLQVEVDNAPAIALYRSAGFRIAYCYHYRVKEN